MTNRGDRSGTGTTLGAARVLISDSPTPIVRIEGEVDLANAAAIKEHAIEALRTDVEHVTVDLTATTYLDSAALAVLVHIASRLEAARTPLTIVAPVGSTANRLIALAGLAGQLGVPIEDDST